MDHGEVTSIMYWESIFNIYGADLDFKTDFYNMSTRMCDNINLEEDHCADCSWLLLNITTDNYPKETTQRMSATERKQLTLSRDSYPMDTRLQGRRKALDRRKAPGRRKAHTRVSTLEDMYLVLDEEEHDVHNVIPSCDYVTMLFRNCTMHSQNSFQSLLAMALI